MTKIPLSVVHYSKYDPQTTRGGVQTFAQTLPLIFGRVEFLTPNEHAIRSIMRSRLPVICDNQFVTDWPFEYPVIGFLHGIGAEKFKATRSIGHWLLARAQGRSAWRPNTIRVACAQWVSHSFKRHYGAPVQHVIRHPIDIDRFDGQLQNAGSRLILHDAREEHKGSRLIRYLEKAFPDWQIEALNCRPEQVADRMRRARAFLHLSRYEGNSVVCNEAMAMNLPCLFTRVGILQDPDGPTDIFAVEVRDVYSNPARLVTKVGKFLKSLTERHYNPRKWIIANATILTAIELWRRVLIDFNELSGWDFGQLFF